MNTVGLAMIVKNGADVLDVCLHSARGLFDQMVVVDTGSTDNTKEIARAFGCEVYDYVWNDDFAAARNFSFSKLNTYWGFWLDDDDLLVGHEHFTELVEKAEALNLDAVILEYLYSLDQVGQYTLKEMEPKLLAREFTVEEMTAKLKHRCNTTQYRERLIRLDPTWQWRYPIHEAMPAEGKRMGKAEQMKIIHRRHVRKEQAKFGRNLRILENVPVALRDERIWFYLGLEYAHHGKLDESIHAFATYIPLGHVEEEKYQALGFMGDLYRAKNDLLSAEQHYLRAIALRPNWRSAYVGMLNTMIRMEHWDHAEHYAKLLRLAEVPETPFAYNPVHEHTGWVLDFVKLKAQRNEYPEARGVLEDALKVLPENYDLLQNFDAVTSIINVKAATQSLADSIEFFLRHDDAESAALLISRLPPEIRADARIGEFVRMTGRACGRANAGILPVGVAWPLHEEIFPEESKWREDIRVQALIGYFSRTQDVRSLLVVGGPEDSVAQLAPLGRQAVLAKTIEDVRGQYDGVLLWSVLEQVKRPVELVARARNALRPGGWLYAWVPNGPASRGLAPPVEDQIRMRSFTPDLLRRVLGTVQMPLAFDPGPANAGQLFLAVPTTLPPGRPRTIAIVCPFAPEAWGWQSLGEGIGGSEEAVIRLSRAFARRGHTVTVYGSGRYEPDVASGSEITYRPLSEYSPADVLIAWRYPEVFTGQLRPLEAGWKALWLHDSMPKDRVAAAEPFVDVIWCISDYHASQYEGVPKIYSGRNGIDPAEFDALDQRRVGFGPATQMDLRNPNKIVYVSTPFRGLDTLLEQHWPEIKRRVPEAELHAYYGWESADRMGATATPEGQAFKQKVTALCEQPGVHWHGRVGQPELYREVRSAGVWAYPTRWHEEHCISAYIAQAAGAWPVVYPLGALPQSVAWGWKVEPAQFVNAVVEATKAREGREEMMAWTRQWTSWDDVASNWERLWGGLCA